MHRLGFENVHQVGFELATVRTVICETQNKQDADALPIRYNDGVIVDTVSIPVCWDSNFRA